MIATTTAPAIRTDGDPWIVRQLEQVRLVRRLQGGELATDRRGRMYFDFDANKVRVAPAEGGAA